MSSPLGEITNSIGVSGLNPRASLIFFGGYSSPFDPTFPVISVMIYSPDNLQYL
ncbi:MAG: hypothetical protein IH840_16610 [Candidatus Heimdallarchaeota archaeon]|nr:hypothetical protein [Candidatus Heimdallarchaeota archaeon]